MSIEDDPVGVQIENLLDVAQSRGVWAPGRDPHDLLCLVVEAALDRGMVLPWGDQRSAPRKKANIPDSVRWQVWERDDFRCRTCGARGYLSVDHIIPESKGGELAMDNLQTLCRRCNSKKGAKLDGAH